MKNDSKIKFVIIHYISTIIIRKAKKEDAKGIATIHVLSWQDTYRGLMPDEMLDSLTIEDRTKRWEHMLSEQNVPWKCIVAVKEEKIIGWATYGKSRDEDAPDDTGELWAIYIHPNHVGKGAGSLLMEYSINELKKENYKKVTLLVLTTNEKTKSWYEKKGWKNSGKSKIDKRGTFELHETQYAIELNS